jgi:hypothetical protein
MAATLIQKTATAAPVAKEATKEAVGALLTASPSSLASFPVLSTVVITVWSACKQLPTSAFNSAWVPLAIAMLLSLTSFLLNFPGRDQDAFRLKLTVAIILIPINGALLAAAALGGTNAANTAGDKLGSA